MKRHEQRRPMSILLLLLLLGASLKAVSSSDHRGNYYGFDVVPEVKRNQIATAKKAIKTNTDGDKVLNFLKGATASKPKISPPSNDKAKKRADDNQPSVAGKHSKSSSSKSGRASDIPGDTTEINSNVPSRRRKKQQKSSQHEKATKDPDEGSSKKMKKVASKQSMKAEEPQEVPKPVNSNDDDLAFDSEEVTCYSAAAQIILDIVPDAVVANPSSCCDHMGSIAAYVTHASPNTTFWLEAYSSILAQSESSSTCFIFTGIKDESTEPEQSILDVVMTVGSLPQVVTLMVVDATTSSSVATALRHMHEPQHQQNVLAPLVGVWHAGYNNILLESITNGSGVLPYVGVASSDVAAVFGTTAAQLSLAILGNDASSLCIAMSLTSAPSECSHWYAGRNVSIATPVAVCDSDWMLSHEGVDVIWASVGCCERAMEAVVDSPTLVGCHRDEVGAEDAHFTLRQPVAFQASTVAAWSNAAVLASQRGSSGRYAFPALGTVVATGLEPVLSL